MNTGLAHITIVVDDYDKAIAFYTQKLHFTLTEDTKLTNTKRWVLVTPKGQNNCSLLLAKASNEAQVKSIGNQTGGRVFLFLNTANFDNDYQNLLDNNIKIIREPTTETYGKVAVFEDIFGNLWDLIAPATQQHNYFYATFILKIKKPETIAQTLHELATLKALTINETGNRIFDIHQSHTDPTIVTIWECFINESAFKVHLATNHLQTFMQLNLVEIANGYHTTKIL